jgi:glycosyltransferase involved in cell wall biosynthesis
MPKGDDILVSVIVPAHNVALYVEQCITSILEGSFRNIQVLVIENGSEDDTPKIVDLLAKSDSRMSVFHYPSMGVSTARNIGLQKASGDYVCFVDGDDLVSVDYIEYLLKSALRDDAEIAVCMREMSFKNEDEINRANVHHEENELKVVGTAEDAVSSILLYKISIGCYSKIFKRMFLEQNNILFEKQLYVGEGFNFNVKAFYNANRIVMSTHKVYYYRISNPNSAMTKISKDKIVNGLMAMDFLSETLKDADEYVGKCLSYAKWHTNFDFLMILVAARKQFQNTVLFTDLVRNSKMGHAVSRNLPVNRKDRFKAELATFNPVLAGALFNKLRKRTFTN